MGLIVASYCSLWAGFSCTDVREMCVLKCFGAVNSALGSSEPIQRITLASNAEGWDKMVNGQLESTLALDERVLVTGFVPGNTQQQREHARELNIDLFDAKFISGYSSTELLAYPPDDLNIDILMMHSYGRDVGRQAQIIKDTKNCKWVLVVHTVSEELEKYAQKAVSRAAVNEPISEHELQVKLCEKADLVVAVGPKVAEAYKAALRYCGKQDSIFTLMPKISSEFLGVRQSSDTKCWDTGEKFRILISGSAKYFKVKGCDIAAKAINLLQDSSYHLILVVLQDDNIAEIQQAMYKEGINVKQLTVRGCSGTTEAWHRLLCEVDLLIKPSRTEGFGMSGLRAISADLPLLVSRSCGLGIALKSLPSGRNHVVDSDEPKIWADKIKEVREKGFKTCHVHAEQLRSEYTTRFLWKEQVDRLLRIFSEMVAQNQERIIAEADRVDGRFLGEDIKPSIQESNQDASSRDILDAMAVARPVKMSHALSTKVRDLPVQVYKQICEQLNVKRDEKFDDFRILAEKVGFSREQIRHFESKDDPTDEILTSWSLASGEATVGKLIELLNGEDLERWDVAKTLKHWVDSQSLLT